MPVILAADTNELRLKVKESLLINQRILSTPVSKC